MHNWHLLLLALIAVIQPISSFTDRSLVDGRQQCCDHQPDSLFRDTRFSLDTRRRIASQDRRVDQRDAIDAGHRLDTKRYTTLTPVKDRASHNRNTNEDARLSNTDQRLITATGDRRVLRNFDKQNLDRKSIGQRFSRNSVVIRNHVESSLRSSQDKRSAPTEDKNNQRIASDTRRNFVRKQSDSYKFRPTTAIRQEFQQTRYEVEQERSTINRLSSPIKTIVNDNRQSRQLRAITNEIRKVVTASIETVGTRQHFRQNELDSNTVKDGRVDSRLITSNNRVYTRDMTPDTRFQRFIDSSNSRNARFDITRKITTTDYTIRQRDTRAQHSQSDESRRSISSDSRTDVSAIATERRAIREKVSVDSRENRRDVTNDEVSRREIVRRQDHHRNLFDKAQQEQSQNLRVKTALFRRDMSNPKINQRYAMSEDRNRNMDTRNERLESFTVRRDTIRREVTNRDIRNEQLHTVVEKRLSSDMRNIKSDGIRRDSALHKFSRRDVRSEDRNSQTNNEIQRRQSMRRVETQKTQTSSVDRDSARKDTRNDERNVHIQMSERHLTSERRQIIRNSNIQNIDERNKEDENRYSPLHPQRQLLNMRKADTIVRNTEIDHLASARTDTRNDDRTRHIHAQISSRRRLIDIREPVAHAIIRDKNMRDMTERERTGDKLRMSDEIRHAGIMHRVEIRENRRDKIVRESNRRAPSLDHLNFRDTTRAEKLTRSFDLSERSDTRQQVPKAMHVSRVHKPLLESRFRITENAKNRNIIDKELSKINSEDQMAGNWQMLFYILQGIYICGVIVHAIQENGPSKNVKTKNQYWWTLASHHLIKVD